MAILLVLVDASPGAIRVRAPDPQNVTEAQWKARLGDIAALNAAYARWRKGRR